ncbi:MAG: hypothetical protein EXR98_03350 [Gemmataceae bacterium]|nr:hypothetical protein [Gemmataceae bacterium]
MNLLCRIAAVGCVLALVNLALLSPVQACEFCGGERNATLVLQIDEAQMVLFGHFENAKLVPGSLDQGQSDFVIEHIYKDHTAIKGLKRLTLPRYITDPKTKYLVFAEIYKGKIDANKGTPVANDGEMVRYIEGIIKLKGKAQPERLRFAFDFLNSPESEVAMDAYREFQRADYTDYKDMAKKLPADMIAGWLEDPKTPSYRCGLYASLLGHCGNAKHAEMLMKMINDPEKRRGSGLFGLMAAYTMLEPQKGWSYLKDLAQDKEKPFLVRYSGLQTMRFLRESRAELINVKDLAAGKSEIVKGIAGIMKVPDMADFAIEDLRKWKQWSYCDQILGLFGQKDFNTPIIRKSILRYALQCDSATAKAFVKEQRDRDKEWVDETRELLELEPVTK